MPRVLASDQPVCSPNCSLPDHTGTVRTLSVPQGRDPLILLFAHGNHRPKRRRPGEALEAGMRIVSLFWGDPVGYVEQVRRDRGRARLQPVTGKARGHRRDRRQRAAVSRIPAPPGHQPQGREESWEKTPHNHTPPKPNAPLPGSSLPTVAPESRGERRRRAPGRETGDTLSEGAARLLGPALLRPAVVSTITLRRFGS